MEVTKRNGKTEEVKFDKIKRRIQNKLDGLDQSVDGDKIASIVIGGIFDGVTTAELDNLIAETAAAKTIDHPDYAMLASRIAVSRMHKETSNSFLLTMKNLHKAGLIADDVLEIIIESNDHINEEINYTRDYSYDYFGYKTLERSYLLKIDGKIVERPQHMLMRVAIGIHKWDLDNAFKTYHLLSEGWFTHATPTLFNAGTPKPQMSSCFLVDNIDDSLEGLFDTMKNVASISKWAGGIGLAVHNVRAKGSYIKGTGGQADGLVPMMRTYNDVARWINQCFAPETLIYTDSGVKKIEDLTKGELVMTKDGKYCEVGEVMSYDQSGGMIEINTKSTLKPLRLTDAHPIYAFKNKYSRIGRSNSEYINQLQKNIVSPNWVDSGDLKVGDFIGKSIPKEVIDVEFFNEEDAFVYGLMLGDGHISGYEAGISFNEATNSETVLLLKKYLTNKNINFWESRSDSEFYLQIRFSISKLIWLKSEILYDTSGVKRLHPSLSHLPLNKSIQIIRGLLMSDGGIYRGNEIHFYNTSELLIENLSYQILRFKTPTYGSWVTRKNNSKYILDNGCKKEYTTSLDLRIPSFKELSEVLKVKEVNKKNWIVWDGILYTRITSIKKLNDYNGKVYDLKIKEGFDDPSYTLSAALVHNGGKRKGSFAMYLEPWHADVFEFLDLKKNHGKEEVRARDLFYALWVPDLFMKRVHEDGMWTLMCPNECPGLHEVHSEEFEALYEKYEREGKGKKTIKAQELWFKILESQIETGTPYMLYKDAANSKSNQQNLGTIKSSNLCCEVVQYTDPEEIAVCNLASIALPKFVKEDGSFDFQKLHKVTRQATYNLNMVIDGNYYPVEEARNSNLKHRPIGLGVQGLADVFMMMRLPFESPEAKILNSQIFETIYHAALTESNSLAKKTQPYSTFEGSPASKGILQFDMWGVKPVMWEWDKLKAEIMESGLANSLLVAPMPTASTAQILGNNECFEPYTSNLYTRRVLSGEFIMINKHLVKDLIKLGLWDSKMKAKLMSNNGSVMNIPEIPTDIKELYKTVWEMSMKNIIDMSADRGAFICQSQSLNIFMDNANFGKLTSMHFHGWKSGLKTGMYYLRTKAATDAIKFTVEKEEAQAQVSCSIDNPDNCEACGS